MQVRGTEVCRPLVPVFVPRYLTMLLRSALTYLDLAKCFTFTALNQRSRGKCIAPILAVMNEVRYCIKVMTRIGVC